MSETRYLATVYHDEPDEAAAESEAVGTFQTVRNAATVIRNRLGEHWHYGSINVGTYTPAISGECPARFLIDDSQTPWQVGRDYIERG